MSYEEQEGEVNGLAARMRDLAERARQLRKRFHRAKDRPTYEAQFTWILARVVDGAARYGFGAGSGATDPNLILHPGEGSGTGNAAGNTGGTSAAGK